MDRGCSTRRSDSGVRTPYVGLSSYTEADSEWFFGRDEECHTIISNLRAARLTILYAPSGVGKSSLLRAGVSREIGELARRRMAERGSPRYIPVVFSEWKDDPVEALIGALAQAVEPFRSAGASAPPADSRLDAAIEFASAGTEARLLIILDQFEEYLLYRVGELASRTFADELARCVNREDLRANFLIAIREDGYPGLGDLFAGRIPHVYGNYLQLEYLDRDPARQSIIGPIEHFNRLYAGDEPIAIEPELVEAVLDQVRTGEVVIGQAGRGAVESSNGASLHREQIETPYLQLVMTSLWTRERELGSCVLRLATLEELGGADEIVRTHLDGALDALPQDEREAALELFRYLVTPSGTKIVYAASDLAQTIDWPEASVTSLLAKLARGGTRIVRHVPPPAGKSQPDDRYEIFHDVLGPAIVDWRRREVEQRRQAEAARERERLQQEKREADERARRERRNARAFRGLAVVALMLLAVAIVAFVLARRETDQAQRAQAASLSRELAAQALTDLRNGPLDQGVLLSLEAYRLAPTTDARGSIIDAVDATHGMVRYATDPASITGVAFSPNGKIIAYEAGNAVVLSDVQTQRRVRILRGNAPLASEAVAFSPDGSALATGTMNGNVIVWDPSTGARRYMLTGMTGSVSGVAFSPDGKTLAASGQAQTVLWDVGTGRRLRTLPDGGPSVAFNPDGRVLATAPFLDRIVLWDPNTGRRLRTLTGLRSRERDFVVSLAFSPNGKLIASGQYQGTVTLWDATTGKRLRTLSGHTSTVERVAFSPDGTTLTSSSADGKIILWSAGTGERLYTLHGHTGTVWSVAFSPDGKTLASGGDDHALILWDAHIARAPSTLRGDAPINSVAFSPDGHTIAFGTYYNGTGFMYDAGTGRRIRLLGGDTDSAAYVAFSPDGRTLAFDDGNGSVILNARTGQTLRTLSGFAPFAFGPDGKTLAAVDATSPVLLFNVATGKLVRTLNTASDNIYSVAFSPDGTLIAAGGDGNSVEVWNAVTGNRQFTSINNTDDGVESVTFSPKGRLLASGSDDQTVIRWEPKTGKQVGEVLRGHTKGVSDITFSPDGKTLASSSDDGTILLWDPATGRQLGDPLRAGHTDSINSVTFSPDGETLASGGDDGIVTFLGPLPTDRDTSLVDARLCSVVRRDLTRSEWNEFLPGQSYHQSCPR